MPGIAEIAATMMTGAERRIDVAAANVSNMNTPGYRARRLFASMVDTKTALPHIQEVLLSSAANTGMVQSGNPLDFAASYGSVMAFGSGNEIVYSRSAQLRRDADGRLVDLQGRALLGADGREIALSSGTPEVLIDGTVLVDGQPQGRIGLFADNQGVSSAASGGLPPEASGATVRQGMLVASGVELGDEMIELNKATRLAETGAKLFQLHDDLLARAASQLGSIGK